MKNLSNFLILAIAAITFEACSSSRATTEGHSATGPSGTVAPASGDATNVSSGRNSSGGGVTVNNSGTGATEITPATGTTTGSVSSTSATTGQPTTGSSAPAGANKADKRSNEALQFIQQAALSGMAEVELSELAVKNAQSDAVKEYAAMVVKDHGAANVELKALATAKGINLEDSLASTKPAGIQSLTTASAEEFNQDYITLMIGNQKTAIDLFEDGTGSSDPEVKAFAKKHLPLLKKHLKQIMALGKITGG